MTNHASATAANPSGCVFFPAAGFLGKDGIAKGRSSYGYYWSGTPKDTNAEILIFPLEYVGMSNISRVFGISVRCVRE